jgi:hypothetical protein
MKALLRRLWRRPARHERQGGVPVRRRPRLSLEALESRWAPAAGVPAAALALVPQPVLLPGPQPWPLTALVRFDAQPVISQLIPPGPTTDADLSFQVQGSFNESGQISPAFPMGPVQPPEPIYPPEPFLPPEPLFPWSQNGSYSLEVLAHETLVPPTGAGAPGSLQVTYSIQGTFNSVLRVAPGPAAAGMAATWVSVYHASLAGHGQIAGTVSAADPTAGQQVVFTSQADTSYQTQGQVERQLPGEHPFETIALERGTTHDQALWNWRESLFPLQPTIPAVSTITASYSGADHLNQDLLVWPQNGEARSSHLAADLRADASADESLAASGPAGPSAGPAGLLLTGDSQLHGRLDVLTADRPSPFSHVIDGTGGVQENVVVVPQPVAQVAPVLLAPIGNISTTTPTFSWTAVPNATHYSFWLEDPTTGVVQFVMGNPSNTLPNFPVTFGDQYVWWVQAQDDMGNGSPVSIWAMFTVFPILHVPPF